MQTTASLLSNQPHLIWNIIGRGAQKYPLEGWMDYCIIPIHWGIWLFNWNLRVERGFRVEEGINGYWLCETLGWSHLEFLCSIWKDTMRFWIIPWCSCTLYCFHCLGGGCMRIAHVTQNGPIQPPSSLQPHCSAPNSIHGNERNRNTKWFHFSFLWMKGIQLFVQITKGESLVDSGNTASLCVRRNHQVWPDYGKLVVPPVPIVLYAW